MNVDNTLSSFVTNLYNKAVSPLSGAFIFSWLVWNFEAVLIAISGTKIESKLSLIEKFYTFEKYKDAKWYFSSLPELSYGVLLPLTSALFFIFIYPIASTWVYRKHLKNQKELLNLKRESDNATLLTKEEHQKWLIDVAKQEQEVNRITDLNNQKIKRLETLIEDYKHREAELNQKINALENDKRDTSTSDTQTTQLTPNDSVKAEMPKPSAKQTSTAKITKPSPPIAAIANIKSTYFPSRTS